MISINGKSWSEVNSIDIETFLASDDAEESFFFEFKDDRVSNKDLTKEISAFANTYGGYIFIGVSDSKDLEGCVSWNELRINTMIHDAITPIPSFDIKTFFCKDKRILVLKVDEGSEPPYITNTGKIYERVSSSSALIKESIRLSQIYSKRERLQHQIEQKISIPPLSQDISGIEGYIDIGFDLTLSDRQNAINSFLQVDYSAIVSSVRKKLPESNITKVGNSIVLTAGALFSNKEWIPSHLDNYIEIMADGCAKMRLLLFEDKNENSVNMMYPNLILNVFQSVYKQIMGILFPKDFIYAKQYSALIVLHRFHPRFYYDDSLQKSSPNMDLKEKDLINKNTELQEQFGITSIVANDRIPKIGLRTIDKKEIEKYGDEYSKDGIIESLFDSSFLGIGSPYFMLKE